jgi:hypothetical protein
MIVLVSVCLGRIHGENICINTENIASDAKTNRMMITDGYALTCASFVLFDCVMYFLLNDEKKKRKRSTAYWAYKS